MQSYKVIKFYVGEVKQTDRQRNDYSQGRANKISGENQQKLTETHSKNTL